MTTTTNPTTLDECTRRIGELDAEMAEHSAAVTTVMNRARDHDRDLEPGEVGQIQDRRTKLAELKNEVDQLETTRTTLQVRQRAAEIGTAIGEASRQGLAGELGVHFRNAEARALNGEGYRFRFDLETAELFERTTTTATAGARHEAVVGASGAGIWLPRESGALNANLPPGARLEAGAYGANTAVSATAEGDDKPNLDPTLTTDTVKPFAVSANVTIQSESAGRGIQQFTWAATRKVRRSVNDAFTAAMVTAGGSARAFDTDAPTSVDGAIAASMADTAATPSLVVCADTVFPDLAQAGGDNARDSFPAYRGIRLVPSTVSALAGNALVIDGTGLTISLSGIEVRTQPQVISNSTDVVVEAWFAVVSHGASAVVLQDATTP